MRASAKNRGIFLKSGIASKYNLVVNRTVKKSVPDFRPGDTIKVHARIVEGNKERIQIFEGMVIRRKRRDRPNASFTVRKVSYNIGVERTFLVHSPRVEKIEVITRGEVRRAKLYYLRNLSGKKARIKTKRLSGSDIDSINNVGATDVQDEGLDENTEVVPSSEHESGSSASA